jgi:hypothetical protein
MSFGTTLSDGYSSLLLDRLVKWYVGRAEFFDIVNEKLRGLEASDFRAESVAPTAVGEWFLDLCLRPGIEKMTAYDYAWKDTTTLPHEFVQVWFLTELYKTFWRQDLADVLLEKEEEEKTLKKKHLTLIGRTIMANDWWKARELTIKRQIINLKKTKKVLEA